MNERGFTLLELLIAAAVLGIAAIGIGVGGFFISAERFSFQSRAQIALQRQAQIIIDELTTQIQPATALAIATCGGVPKSLQVTNSDGTYCFRRNSPTGTQLLEDRPGGGTSMNLLNGALVPGGGTSSVLTTVDGATVDGGGNCGTTAGFCPGLTGSAPAADTTASVVFRLRVQIPETDSYQTMTFTTTIARRN